MKKIKVFIGFSEIICLLMCALSLSESFFYSRNVTYYAIKSAILNQIFNNVFNIDDMPALNNTLLVVFLLCFVSLLLHLFNMNDKRAKYFSFFNAIVLIWVWVLFISYVGSNIIYYDIFHDEQLSLEFKIFMWLPRMLIFSVPTLYLIFFQVYLIRKSNYIKFTKTFTISSIYVLSLIFLTLVTFYSYSELADNFFELLRLKTSTAMLGENVYFETHVNTNYYIYYVIFITVLFGLAMLISIKKSKKQELKA